MSKFINNSDSKMMPKPFYNRSTVLVAIDLIGKLLSYQTPQGILSGKIVEVEAYLGDKDPACHAYVGKTQRTKIFWGEPGIAYVFLIYGIYHCLNIITKESESLGCVLIRAIEPIEGIDVMQENRGYKELFSLTNGPGKLTQALGITLEQNGADLINGDLSILYNESSSEIFVSSRIGISKAKNAPLRFYEYKNPFVSYGNKKISIYSRGPPKMIKKDFVMNKIVVDLK